MTDDDRGPGEESFSARFLAPGPTWPAEARRLGVALGLAAAYGAALGARGGAGAMLAHAAGAPAAIAGVGVLGVPALAIVLALADAPVRADAIVRAAVDGAARAGLVLGGLAPALALVCVTAEDAATGAIYAGAGLVVAGRVGLRAFRGALAAELTAAPPRTRRSSGVATASFALFAAVLAGRIWWAALPALGGGP